jgi:hypothetical protein
MIGPLQLIMIEYDQPTLPAALVTRIQDLAADPAIRVVDVADVCRDQDGNLQQIPIADIVVHRPDKPGAMIMKLLSKAGAADTLGKTRWTGPTDLFRGGLLPDPHTTIRAHSRVLVILVEHRWAAALRDTAGSAETHPVANGWIGQDMLKELELLPELTS